MSADVPARTGWYARGGKRCLDVAFSSIGIVLLAPVLAAISATILLRDGRPVLFVQQRVGRHGRDFPLYKFRSMANAPAGIEAEFAPGDRARVTATGAFLRRSKLDELPQLFNVIRGEMSLVGPRPEVRRWVAEFPERWNRILVERPGITDEAAIVFRDEEDILAREEDPDSAYRDLVLPRKLSLYERYVHELGPRRDLGIVLRTLIRLIR